MNLPMVIDACTVLLGSNQSPNLEPRAVDHRAKYSYTEVMTQLKECGHMSLEDMQELSHADLNNVFEEIKCWCVYGNHDPRKLRTVLNGPYAFI